MPVPTTFADLSTTIASNSPAGSDNVFPDLDNYIRALAGMLASVSANSGNGWTSPYLALLGGTVSGSTTFSGAVTLSGSVSGAALTNYLAAPAAIGGTTPAAGAFTTLSASSTVSGAGFSTYLASPPAIGGTAAAAGSFTTLSASGAVTLSGGTANGVLYLNGSKVATSGSALTFDGTNFATTGTASATKLIPTGGSATGNGMYLPAANTLAWSNNGAETMRLDSSGNLGLGVTPSAWLSSQKALEVSGWSVNAASLTSSLATNAYVNASSQWIYKATGFATRYDNVTGQHQWYTAPSGTAGNTISFTQAMTLTANGRLLVGTTTDSGAYALQLGGDILLQSTSNGIYSNNFLSVSSSADTKFTNNADWIWQNTTPSTLMTLKASGNLGIGTSPVYRLHVYNGAAPVQAVFESASTSDAIIRFRNGATGALSGVYGTNTQALVFEAGGTTERARITSTGNVVAGGSVALATTATDGFLYVPTCAGTPTGVPTAITGMAPIVVNTTNNKLYFYSGGAWRDAGP